MPFNYIQTIFNQHYLYIDRSYIQRYIFDIPYYIRTGIHHNSQGRGCGYNVNKLNVMKHERMHAIFKQKIIYASTIKIVVYIILSNL